MIVLLKRSVSLFLVLLLIIGVFTACATKDKDDDANLVTATVKYKDIAKDSDFDWQKRNNAYSSDSIPKVELEKDGYYMIKIVCTINNGSSRNLACNGVQREHNKKLNNGLPILHKVPPKRDYGRYFCIMAEKGGTSHGGLTEKLSLFFHAKKQEVNAYGR